MNTVKLPRASWDEVIMCLDILKSQGYIVQFLRDEIDEQIARQEY